MSNGLSAEKFEKKIHALGGPSNILSSFKNDLKIISFKKDIFANKKGWIKKIHTRELGLILIELGGGRKQVTDKINFSVGYDNVATIGDIIDTSKPLITVYSQTENDYERLRKKIEDCFVITENEVSKLPEIYEVIK